MKKIVLLLCLCLPLGVLAQNKAAKRMLTEIEGSWKLDNNGNVTMSRIIEMPGVSKEELYNRALSYFTYNYRKGDAVVQIEDKDQGLIIGKGLYQNVHSNLYYGNVDTYHVIRVDVKDEKLRVIVTITAYCVDNSATMELLFGIYRSTTCEWAISSCYPIAKGNEDENKTFMVNLFYNSYKRAINTMDMLEKSLIEGNTGMDLESW